MADQLSLVVVVMSRLRILSWWGTYLRLLVLLQILEQDNHNNGAHGVLMQITTAHFVIDKKKKTGRSLQTNGFT